MLSWLYDIFVTIVSFVMGLFGFDLKKRSVSFADDTKKSSVDDTTNTIVSNVSETKESEIVQSLQTESATETAQ